MAGTLAPDYPNAITICSTTSTGLQPFILDIGAFMTPGYPPVLQVVVSATATVIIYGAIQLTTANPAVMVNPIDVTNGGFTASDFYDIIPGIRFYQVNVTANTGEVIVAAGVGPQLPGNVGLPQTVRYTNNAPQGT